MTLAAGSHIGPYEIVAPIGAGGMGSASGPSGARMHAARASGGGAPRALSNANFAQDAHR